MAENNNAIDRSAINELTSIGQKLGSPHQEHLIHYAVVPNDSKIESLEKLQYPHGLPPSRIKVVVSLRDAKSFASYVKSYWDTRTQVFAEPATTTFQAILDYHGKGEMKPEFCDHKALFKLQPDDRWKIWSGQDNKPMTQVDFAEFIEDNMADITKPEPAEMLEIARDLSAHIEVNFGSSTRLATGQTRLRYEETVKAGVPSAGDIDVPEDFWIRIPVFYGEESVIIRARLRFRITQSKLSFHYKLNRPAEVISQAFETAVKEMNTELSTEILMGSPSA